MNYLDARAAALPYLIIASSSAVNAEEVFLATADSTLVCRLLAVIRVLPT